MINFMHISVYTSIPIAQFITPPPPPPCHFPTLVSIRLFSTSVSQLLPCKPVHLNHFSRFHIHAVFYFLTRFLISESTFSQLIQLFFGLVLHEFIDLTKLESFLRLSSRTHTHTHTHTYISPSIFSRLLVTYVLHHCAVWGRGGDLH